MMRDTDIDDLLKGAAEAAPDAPPGLLARVLADAYDAQPEVLPAVPARTGLLARLRPSFAGFTGLAAASLAGLWAGFATPDGLTAVTAGLGLDPAIESVELIPDVNEFLTEG